MKKIVRFHLLALFSLLFSPCISKAQSSDTTYLNLSHVMMANGQILSNASTNRICYTLDGSKFFEEKVIADMSFPDGKGGTTVNRNEEEFTVVDGKLDFYKGTFTSGDTVTYILAEREANQLVISGKMKKNASFEVWAQEDLNQIDFFVFYIDLLKMNFTKKETVKKIYDMYSLTLRDNHMRHLGEEEIELAGEKFKCKIIKFDYGKIKGRMWFAKEPSGNYFLVKEEAVSKAFGPFNMDLTDYSTTKPSNNVVKEGEFGF